jgi:hypothetical protein
MTSQVSEARHGARPPPIARPSQARTGHPNLIPRRTWRLNASLGHLPLVGEGMGSDLFRVIIIAHMVPSADADQSGTAPCARGVSQENSRMI